ncbi:hypothetical protein [Stieleria varia]|uniref:Uncharacterized protein n=1 Tax=Stieleria varia TaxID=2528005 RepID=A0A5C6B426_9BACT|nr:hypothetical protein [Stieleria varia]TWU06241.1 hypothetical protein Pla52n_19620 [Stieleria varia]
MNHLGTIVEISDGSAGASSAGNSGQASMTYQIINEVGPLLKDSVQEATFDLPANKFATTIKIRAVADASAARHGESPNFVASIRRKECKSLAESVAAIPNRPSSVPAVVATQQLLRKLTLLIERIQSIATEANSREILRQVRDTFLDGQWDLYETPGTADKVAGILTKLSSLSRVEMADIKQSSRTLEQSGFLLAGFMVNDGR